MGEPEHFIENHLVLPVRESESPRRADGGGASGTPGEFPVFGEQALREFENSPLPRRIFDLETLKYLAVNDAMVKLYGYSREEFLGLTVLDTCHPEDHAAFRAALIEQSHYLRHRLPRRHLKKSGEIILVELVSQDILFDGRRARLTLVMDITARVRMQELLRQRQQEFESLADNLPDLVARFDRSHRFVYVNSAVEKLLAVPRHAMIGKTQKELGMPEALVAKFARSLDEAIETAKPHMLEFDIERPEGKRLFEAYHIPERDTGARIATVLCVAHDITERQQAELQLRESRERLAWVLNATGVGLWLNPLPLSKLNWDDRTREIFSLPAGVEPTIELFWERLHPEDREPTRLAVEAALRDRTLYAIEHRVVNPATGAIRWIRSAGKALYDAQGVAIRFDGINFDISERKQAEAERLEGAVRQRDALVREVHHRIKNSLQGVAGLLRQKITRNPGIAAEIEETIGQLQSVALVYGLQETRPDGLLSLVTIMDAICSSAEGLIGGRVERAFERKSRRPACVAGQEAVSVAFALNELVFNALKHQPAEAGEKRARVTLRESLHEAEICITNRGRLPKGFDFAEGRAVGSGLGLVRTLLAAPGGSIAFNGGRNQVEVVLKLRPPLLAERQDPVAR
ncbi:MAG: PAS domain S-box protein [Betaproteobacteria bacterium]|nr:PAS domain S-box protein [Betaproteobacteria bacterium]